MLRRLCLTLAVTFAVVGVGTLTPVPVIDQACPASASATLHHALVIIDTGTEVHRRCIAFFENHISGRRALELAGARPLYKEFSGMGSFVCRLYDTGRPVNTCVGDPTYWVYSRAPAGSAGFTASEVGASSAEVHDGDVEGWKWATEGAPVYASADSVCADSTTDAARAPIQTRYQPRHRSGVPTVIAFLGTLAVVGVVWLRARRRRA